MTAGADPDPSGLIVALDVGGTSMKCALVRPDGAAVHTERHATDAGRGPAAVVETILAVAEGLAGKARADGHTPLAVGVAVPGIVDEPPGWPVWSANVGFRDVPLRDWWRRACACRPRSATTCAPVVSRGPAGAGRDAGTCSSSRSAPASPPRIWSAVGRHRSARSRRGDRPHPGTPPTDPAAAAAVRRLERWRPPPRSAAATPSGPARHPRPPPGGGAGRSCEELAGRLAGGRRRTRHGLATGQALFDVETIVWAAGWPAPVRSCSTRCGRRCTSG